MDNWYDRLAADGSKVWKAAFWKGATYFLWGMGGLVVIQFATPTSYTWAGQALAVGVLVIGVAYLTSSLRPTREEAFRFKIFLTERGKVLRPIFNEMKELGPEHPRFAELLARGEHIYYDACLQVGKALDVLA